MRPALVSALGFAVVMSASVGICISAQGPAPQREPEGFSSIQADPTHGRSFVPGRSFVWTEAAMSDAEPLPQPVADPDAVRAAFETRSAGSPEAGATDEGLPARERERQSGNIRYYPLTRAGRLFFNKPDDSSGRYLCSAQFVARDVILTASHCVQAGTPPFAYYKNFTFALQYEKGSEVRKYGYKCVGNKKGWAQESNARYLYDYAMIQTDAPSDVGWFGLQWNWMGRFDSATRIGYPLGSFEGQVIQVDGGPLSAGNGLVTLKHGFKSNQHGSSGGGYVGDYSTNPSRNANHIISLTSFIGETPGISYGPYFTAAILSLLNYVKAGCKEQ
jgi:hypothetical protein